MKQPKQIPPIIAKTLALTGFAALFLIDAIPAHAINIDFQSLEQVNGTYNFIGSGGSVATTYTEKGFTLDAFDSNNYYGFSVWGTLSANYPGSTALFNSTIEGFTRLTQVGNGAFNLASIDLTSLGGNVNVTVGFTGTKADLSTVTQSFTTDNVLSTLETFTFNSDFTNLTQVTWKQDYPFHQFDNINVSAVAVPWETDTLSVVGSTVLFGLGLWGKHKLTQKKNNKKD
jgi:hypothetical protein